MRTLVLLLLGPVGWMLLLLESLSSYVPLGERGSTVEMPGLDNNEDFDLSVYNNISEQNGLWD